MSISFLLFFHKKFQCKFNFCNFTELTENISRAKENTTDLLNYLENQDMEQTPEVKKSLIELLEQVKQFHVTCINEIQKHSMLWNTPLYFCHELHQYLRFQVLGQPQLLFADKSRRENNIRIVNKWSWRDHDKNIKMLLVSICLIDSFYSLNRVSTIRKKLEILFEIINFFRIVDTLTYNFEIIL